ncbi:MAG: DMT family transporter [Nitrospinaceae bacterium]|nr:DMT family transporter [Nitrospinaceae bacterium]MBT3433670.1 DMT family transporter [Nitrospinaceae bacterium]MBT3819984.1 DMT family transporter [Nitrospinaceae bacterium]MBT4431509.1 DMT family transporter [Nitrospinaceae bacterium]MBT5369931.1 DMT family transporter [Nitrospinaceae bacterium]
MSIKDGLKAYGFLGVGVFTLGWSAILIRFAEASPLAIAAYRMLGAALVLLPFSAGSIVALWRGLAPRERWIWMASSVFLALHFALWIESLRHTSVASSVVLVTTNPIFAGVGGWLFLGDKEERFFWAGVGVTIGGALLLVWGDAGASATAATGDWSGTLLGSLLRGSLESLLGNALALGGAVMASGYLLCGRALRRNMPLIPYVTVCYGVSGTILILAAFLAAQPLSGYSPSTWSLLAAMVLGPTLIGHTAVNWALKHMPPGKVALSILGEPVVAAVLAWWLLAEPLGGMRALACAIILAGIAWGASSRK